MAKPIESTGRNAIETFRYCSSGDWLSFCLHTENIEFQNLKVEVQVLKTTAIASGYAGRDPQGGTSDGSFFASSLLSYKK